MSKRSVNPGRAFSFYILLAFFLHSLPVYADLVPIAPDPVAAAKQKGEQCRIAFEKMSRLAQLRDQTPSTLSTHHNPPEGLLKTFLKNGKPLTYDVLRKQGIPAEMLPFYNLQTGEFNYQPKTPLELAKENGDTNLKAIRMNWDYRNPDIGLEYLRELSALLQKKPGMEIWIAGGVGEKRLENAIANLPREVRKQIKVIGADSNNNLWAQDASKPLAEGAATLRPPGMALGRDSASYFAPIYKLQEAGLVQVRSTPFRFEGGNIVVGDKHVFVGPDIVTYAVEDFKISRDEAIKALSKEFGKQVVEVAHHRDNSSVQIDFHLDLTMAVVRNRKTGKETVLIGSVKKAAELLTKDFRETNTAPRSLGELAKGSSTSGPTGSGEKKLAGLFENINDQKLEERESKLDGVAEQMRALGYEVERVPDLSNRAGHTLTRVPEIYNYTNIILSGDVALVPAMGAKVFDESMDQTMRNLGYDPVPFKVVQETICLAGGVRCISETYRRPEAPKRHK
jgi:hypothetical protein